MADNLVVTWDCDETEHIPESASINSSNGTDYLLISVILLAIACLLLLVIMVVKYYMERGLAISCSLSY